MARTLMVNRNVRRRRGERGLTLAQVADRARISESAVSRIEAGGRMPAAVTLAGLAFALDTEVAALTGRPDGDERGEAYNGDMSDSDRFRQRVKDMLERRGMSISELARRAECSQPGLSRILGGKHGCTIETASRIADALEVPLSNLFAAEKISQPA